MIHSLLYRVDGVHNIADPKHPQLPPPGSYAAFDPDTHTGYSSDNRTIILQCRSVRLLVNVQPDPIILSFSMPRRSTSPQKYCFNFTNRLDFNSPSKELTALIVTLMIISIRHLAHQSLINQRTKRPSGILGIEFPSRARSVSLSPLGLFRDSRLASKASGVGSELSSGRKEIALTQHFKASR